jgi:hypothetical protein
MENTHDALQTIMEQLQKDLNQMAKDMPEEQLAQKSGLAITNGLNAILQHYYAMQKDLSAAEGIIWALLTKAGGEVTLNRPEMIASKQPGCFFKIENNADKMTTTFTADRHRIDTLGKVH